MRLLWCTLVALAILQGVAPVAAQPAGAEADTSAASQGEGSWITRNLERYFGGSDQQSVDLEGESVEVADAYRKHAGKPIEVVIVHQVSSFREGWDSNNPSHDRLMHSMTGSFQSYTQDRVIREYLLFKQGDKLDPYALADSEVMLRNLSYINDVRIVIIPLAGEIESVAVVVETTDRWPFGINGKIITVEKYSVELYSENMAGTGTRFSNQFLHKSTADPSWGYQGRLRKENIRGTFLAAEVMYEESYRRHSRLISVERQLAHPGLRGVGGMSAERTDQFDVPTTPRKYNDFDIWLGEVRRLYDVREPGLDRRPILVPAARFSRREFLRRRAVTPDSNRGSHDRDLLLVGLTFQRLKNYKTSYLFGDGETEDLPVGMVLKASGGYEAREFQDRTPLFAEAFFSSVRHRGDGHFLGIKWGGYFRNRRIEDGLFEVRSGLYSPLLGRTGRYLRFFGGLNYTLGINRYPQDRIYLNSRAGIRDLPSASVAGNQRLVASLETRLFTHLALWGFRFSFLGYVDGGLAGGEDASSIFKEKIYVSTGIGVRLRNPSLVLPTVQLQVGFVTNVDDPGFSLAIDVGNASGKSIRFPGTKPSIPAYE